VRGAVGIVFCRAKETFDNRVSEFHPMDTRGNAAAGMLPEALRCLRCLLLKSPSVSLLWLRLTPVRTGGRLLSILARMSRKFILPVAIVALSAGLGLAQFRRGRFENWDSGPIVQTEGGQLVNEDTVRTARETAPHSVDLPDWTNAPAFDKDVFTFARIVFKSRPGRPSWLGWINDYPDSDLNLSYRLQELTSMKVNPDGRVLKLTDPTLFEYPFIFMAQPGGLELNDEEVGILRKYLLNGGALLVDDFWGDRDWNNFEYQMSRVLPERKWSDLPMDHPVFHCVFDINGPMNKLQVPTIHIWRRNYDPDNPGAVPTRFRGQGSQEMHVRAWTDDQQRIMVIALHNSDNGDGWEREGEDEVYFREFSEARAYPLAINIIFYLMTH
jgi:hypothetical protein